MAKTREIACAYYRAERNTGVDSTSIGRVCNGKRKSAGGYHWKWI